MKGDKADKAYRGTWSRRDVVRIGSMATAAGVMGSIAVTDAAAASPFDSADLATPLRAQQARASQLPADPKGPQVYTRIGVRPFINLTGTLTINGGALTLPEVRDASLDAGHSRLRGDRRLSAVLAT